MTITITQMWSKSGGQGTSEKYDAFATTFSHTSGYFAVCEVTDTEEDVLGHSDLPLYGDRHPSGVDSFVRTKTATRISPIAFTVDIGYEGKRFDANVDLTWASTTSTEAIDRDYDGNAIVTVNGEPVEGLTMDIAEPVAVIRRKFFFVDIFAIGPYLHATNSDTFLGWPPGTARLVSYDASNQFKFGAPLEQWDVTARIQFRYPLMGATNAQAWYKRWRSEGLYIDDGLGNIVRALDYNSEPVVKPVLLKSDGTQETNPNNAIFNYTQIYGSLPYGSLGLI